MNKKLITLLHTLPSMGMAFIVLGVLLMVASFAFSIQGNSVLFAGLFFILAGASSSSTTSSFRLLMRKVCPAKNPVGSDSATPVRASP